MRRWRDGQRDVNRLAKGIRITRIGRDVLVVDIDSTLDEPIVGRYSIQSRILVTNVVAVVDNGLRTVYEVTWCLPFRLVVIIWGVLEQFLGNGTSIQGGQKGLCLIWTATFTMLVLGIDIATTHTGLHINQVKLYHTSNRTPVLLA